MEQHVVRPPSSPGLQQVRGAQAALWPQSVRLSASRAPWPFTNRKVASKFIKPHFSCVVAS
jgi:hypothetical protein